MMEWSQGQEGGRKPVQAVPSVFHAGVANAGVANAGVIVAAPGGGETAAGSVEAVPGGTRTQALAAAPSEAVSSAMSSRPMLALSLFNRSISRLKGVRPARSSQSF